MTRCLSCIESAMASSFASSFASAFHSGITGLCLGLVLFGALPGCSSVSLSSTSGPHSAGAAHEHAFLLQPEQAQDVTIRALGLVGTPYRFGGNTPESGFDCSGLIAYVYQTQAGVKTPRTVAQLQSWGQSIAPTDLRSGDLVLFSKSPLGVPHHAGIYVGKGRFVHAPSTGGDVRLDPLEGKYWASMNVVFRRP